MEPAFLGDLAPMDAEALAELPPMALEEPAGSAEDVLPPMEGPLPLQNRKKGKRPNLSVETIRRETGLAFLNRILDDPLYLANLLKDAQEGKLDKQLQVFMWQRVHGRPSEAPKDEGGAMPEVKIVHEFTSPASKGE